MSRIVVLGGAGIIGQAIAQDLAEDVPEVVVADLDLGAAQKVADRLGRGCVATTAVSSTVTTASSSRSTSPILANWIRCSSAPTPASTAPNITSTWMS